MAGDEPITYNARPVRSPALGSDRNGVDRDMGLFMGQVVVAATLNLGLRYDQFIGESREPGVGEPLECGHDVW
jgi:hypothetical protein